MDKRASFVITNYNGRANLERCLPQVLEAARSSDLCDEVLVVDDCSTDDSVRMLEKDFPQVRVVRLKTRSSFLGAANEGFKQVKSPYVALLSNDMAPAPDFLARLLPYFDSPDIFAAHATVVGPGGEVVSERTVGRFLLGNFKVVNTAKPKRGLARILLGENAPTRFSLFSGACAVFDRKKFFSLGGLDPLYYPFYWEDVDICFRAWRRAWKTVNEPACKVAHYHQDLGTISRTFAKPYIRTIERRNRYLFLWSNIDDPLQLGSHVAYLAANFVFSAMVGRVGFYESLIGGLKRLPEVLKRRRRRPRAALSDQDIFATVTGESETSQEQELTPLPRAPRLQAMLSN